MKVVEFLSSNFGMVDWSDDIVNQLLRFSFEEQLFILLHKIKDRQLITSEEKMKLEPFFKNFRMAEIKPDILFYGNTHARISIKEN